MRIAYIFPEPLPSRNASGLQVLRTSVALAERADEVRLYVAGDSRSNDEVFAEYGIRKPLKLKVIPLARRIGPVVWSGRFNRRLRRELLQWFRDSGRCTVLTRHLQVASALLPTGWTTVFESHEFFQDKPGVRPKVLRLESQVLTSVDAIVFLTHGLRDRVAERLNISAPTAVVPSGTDVTRDTGIDCDNESGALRDFVYAGSMRYPWKGVGVLLAAVDLLVDQRRASDVPRLHLVGALEGEVSRQQSLFSRLLRHDALKTYGYVEPSALRTLLRRFKVAVMPNTAESENSKFFTSPLKLLEYMAAGIAVVASDLPSIREIVSSNEALLVTPGCPQALADGIRRLLCDSTLRRRLAASALRRVQEFSWERRAEKLVALMQEAAARQFRSIAS